MWFFTAEIFAQEGSSWRYDNNIFSVKNQDTFFLTLYVIELNSHFETLFGFSDVRHWFNPNLHRHSHAIISFIMNSNCTVAGENVKRIISDKVNKCTLSYEIANYVSQNRSAT